MSLPAITISALLIIIVIQYLLQSSAESCTTPTHLRNPQQCEILLKRSTLKQRAQPNQRLVQAFGIDNSVTTIDSEWHKTFVNRAKTLLRTKNDDWNRLASAASDAIQQSLNNETTEWLVILIVQVLVFQVVMLKFFPAFRAPSKEDIEFVTSRINSNWIKSKACCDNKTEIISIRLELEHKLQEIFDVGDVQGRNNPLNILLPTYETLWRIVLRTFLEVRFRSTDEHRYEYRQLFQKFLNNPADKMTEHNERLVSVERIVKEGLRLCPPTRRIYRQHANELVAVDIEHLHRNESTWGVDALRFLPAR